MAPPTVTVVVPTHNRRSGVIELIDALGRQADITPGEFEVIVVADGCTDGTAAALTAVDRPFHLTVIEQVHSGPASARNRGITAANGEVIVFLDDDVAPLESLLAAHRRLHEASTGVVVIGSVISSGARRSAWDAYDDAMREKRQAALMTSERPSGIHSARNLSIRKSHVEAAGGFRGNLPGNQEVELGYRLRRDGAAFVFSSEAAALDRRESTYAGWLATHSTRGKLDVATYKKGSDGLGLEQLFACFYERRPALRIVLRPLVRWRAPRSAALWSARHLGRFAHRAGAERLSLAAFSLVANTVYWASVRDAMRSRHAFFSMLSAARHVPGPVVKVVPLARRRLERPSGRPAEPGPVSQAIPDRPQDVRHGGW